MRTISNYLLTIGEKKDTLEEIEDLLTVAPSWYMSINQLGYFNQVCVLALMGRLDESLDALSEIPRNAGASASIRETLEELAHDPDFNNLIADGRRSQKFRGIELELFPHASEFNWKNREGRTYCSLRRSDRYARESAGGSRTTWERAATSQNGGFVVVDGAWPLPPRGPRSL